MTVMEPRMIVTLMMIMTEPMMMSILMIIMKMFVQT